MIISLKSVPENI